MTLQMGGKGCDVQVHVHVHCIEAVKGCLPEEVVVYPSKGRRGL